MKVPLAAGVKVVPSVDVATRYFAVEALPREFVERAEWFVHQQQVGTDDHRAGY